MNKAFVADTGKVVCNATHVNIKENQIETTTLWKTTEDY